MYDMLQLVDDRVYSTEFVGWPDRIHAGLSLPNVGKLKFNVHLTGPSQPASLLVKDLIRASERLPKERLLR